MKNTKCDICKKRLSYAYCHLTVINDEGEELEYDLCPECYLKLEKFIKKERTKNERA